jgi:hypothetical protein
LRCHLLHSLSLTAYRSDENLSEPIKESPGKASLVLTQSARQAVLCSRSTT